MEIFTRYQDEIFAAWRGYATEHGWGTGRTISDLVAAAVLLVAFVVIEMRSRNPTDQP